MLQKVERNVRKPGSIVDSRGLTYEESKVVHWLRMGASDAGFNARTLAATTKARMTERGEGEYFIEPPQRLKKIASGRYASAV